MSDGVHLEIEDTDGREFVVQNTDHKKKLIKKIDKMMTDLKKNAKTNVSAAIVLKEGTKFDSGKIPLELIPTAAVEEIAKVLAFGAKKYDSWNWAKGMGWSRLIGAALRHIFAYSRGIDKDPETGLSHLAHAGCCILFLIQYDLSKLGKDDRYKEFNKGEESNGV